MRVPEVHMAGHVNGHAIVTPTELKVAAFTPDEDFYSEEFKTDYVAGLTYWLREGNLKLANCLLEWPVDITVIVKNHPLLKELE